MHETSVFPTRWSAAAVMIATLGLGVLLLGGCTEKHADLEAGAAGQVVIKGSNTFGEELGPRLVAEYRTMHPRVTVALEASNSGAGLAALLAGQCDIAATSRRPTPAEEAAARAKGVELKEYLIGYYGVAVIVHAENPVKRLTPAQVKGIFTGTIRNWREVGGPDRPIRLAVRDPASGTSLGFRELAMENRAYAAGAVMHRSYAELAAAVAAEPGTVGYADMHLVKGAGIRAVRIGDTEPTTLSVNEGWYPYARKLRLYTNGKAEAVAACDFALFVQHAPGQRILEELGFVRRFEKRLNALIPE